MKISFKKDVLWAKEFHFKAKEVNEDNEDIASDGPFKVEAKVNIPKESVLEIKKNRDKQAYGIFITLPIEIDSPYYVVYTEYESIFITNEFESTDDKKNHQMIVNKMDSVIKKYLDLVNKEIIKFINNNTQHRIEQNSNLLSSLVDDIKIQKIEN